MDSDSWRRVILSSGNTQMISHQQSPPNAAMSKVVYNTRIPICWMCCSLLFSFLWTSMVFVCSPLHPPLTPHYVMQELPCAISSLLFIPKYTFSVYTSLNSCGKKSVLRWQTPPPYRATSASSFWLGKWQWHPCLRGGDRVIDKSPYFFILSLGSGTCFICALLFSLTAIV